MRCVLDDEAMLNLGMSQDGYDRTKYLVAGSGLEDPAQFLGSPKFGSTYPICSNMWYRNTCFFLCSLNMFFLRP